ncbi:hypothetical protein NL108_016783 [Boleophthalmus pectinirostris]|nr:hypothetical protein NL108_016783 [Boleophthalmus pectinirostris]
MSSLKEEKRKRGKVAKPKGNSWRLLPAMAWTEADEGSKAVGLNLFCAMDQFYVQQYFMDGEERGALSDNIFMDRRRMQEDAPHTRRCGAHGILLLVLVLVQFWFSSFFLFCFLRRGPCSVPKKTWSMRRTGEGLWRGCGFAARYHTTCQLLLEGLEKSLKREFRRIKAVHRHVSLFSSHRYRTLIQVDSHSISPRHPLSTAEQAALYSTISSKY